MDKKWRKSIFNSCHSMVDISWPSLLNGHLAAIKSFILQKRSKNSLKCFRGQILSDTKTTGNQCWNAQETHRPHDLSIGKDHLLSQKQESSSAYSTRIFKVQVLNDQALFLIYVEPGWIRAVWTAWQRHYCLMHFCYIANFLSYKEVSFFSTKG